MIACFMLAAVRFCMIGFGAESLVLLLIAQVLHAATFGVHHSASIASLQRWFHGPLQARGQALFISVSYGLGGTVGGLVLSIVWDKFGPQTVYSLAALMAIGGAVAAAFYLEPAETEDVDVFVALKASPQSSLISMDPIYKYARSRDWPIDGEYIVIAEWPVQFLPPDSPLVEEAIANAVEKEIDGLKVRVFTAEHLMTIALKLGRAKDKLRLVQFLEASSSSEPKFRFDERALNDILSRHTLLDRWVSFKRQTTG